MQTAHYLILGGGIAGTTAAETIRKLDSTGTIMVIDSEGEPLYSRVLLPHFVKGQIPEEQVYLRQRSWYDEQKIGRIEKVRATSIDPVNRRVELNNNEVIEYNKLLISTGGVPNTWDIPGGSVPNAVPLWTLEDGRKMKYLLARGEEKHAVAVGGGFICTDLVPIFLAAGWKTTLVVREPHFFWGLLDEESSRIFETAMIDAGLTILYNEEVVAVSRETHTTSLQLLSGRVITADLIGLGIGVHADSSLFRSAGLNVKQGGVETNEYLETSMADIWAAGDTAVFFDVNAGIHHKVGNWTNSQEQGRTAGVNMVGKERQPYHLVTAYTVQLFGCSLSFVGDFELTPDIETVVVGDTAKKERGRLLLYKNRLVGATLCNLPQLRGPLTQLIQDHVDLLSLRATLEKGSYVCLLRTNPNTPASWRATNV
ncbi:MAG: FAD-dependent oxidoreductase [bacterium]|nr:FAD-dependent oxidoreductase [bacterium]